MKKSFRLFKWTNKLKIKKLVNIFFFYSTKLETAKTF